MDNSTQEGVPSAIADGRRIYLGNLLYSVKPEDVDALLQEAGLGKYDKIHLSFDPISARNPGYCFVEFFHKDDAEAALTALATAELAGRPLKVGPCHAKAPSQREGAPPRRERVDATPANRWGDWKTAREERGPASPEPRSVRAGPDRNLSKLIGHHEEMATGGQGKRLFVGGLDKMENQEQHQEEVRGYFAGYDIEAVGKRITPREETRDLPGAYHYCFVDLATPEEAERAIKELNGSPIPSGALKVSMAKPPRPRQTDSYDSSRSYSSPRRNGAPGAPDAADGADRAPRARVENPQPQRSLMSNNWRSKPS